jgi:hypothetical protein
MQSFKKRHKRMSVVCACLLTVFAAHAQVTPGEGSNAPLSPSLTPNAQGLSNVDVDLFHGNVNVSIPLFEYKSKELSVPVSLVMQHRAN